MTRQVNPAGQFGSSQFTVSQTSSDAAYTTIAEALTDAAAAGGGTVIIQPGLYSESLVWPANVQVEGASAPEAFSVVLIGNQTFSDAGDSSFQNIHFFSPTGNSFSQINAAGTSNLTFTDCKFEALTGIAYNLAPTGTLANLTFQRCTVLGSTSVLTITGVSLAKVINSGLTAQTNNSNVVDLGGSGVLQSELTIFNTSGSGTGNCVSLNSGTCFVDSSYCTYTAGGGATASAFRFTINGASVTTVNDKISVSGGTYWASATGVLGLLRYGNAIIVSGTTSLIDPQITSISLNNASQQLVEWVVYPISAIVPRNSGSFANGAITLTLPAAPDEGDMCEFIISTSANLNITASINQTIRIGNIISALGGTTSSGVIGNSLSLVYCDLINSWVAKSIIGNWVI